ncbi:MAG: chloride channel protein [Intestinimonas sp.]|nr:chloride channel protein [Intestinimonas sp.]
MKQTLKETWIRIIAFLKWIVAACALGIVVGSVGVAFHNGIEVVTALRTSHPWLIYFLPLGGASIVLLYRICGMEKDRGTNLVLVAARENEPMKLRTAPLVFLSTLITHLVGGSSGREGAVLQIGGSIASHIGNSMKLRQDSVRILVVCGMASAFSALFGTPLTSAMFAMEMVHVGVIHYSAIVPCILSCLVAVQLASFLGVPPTAFVITGIPALSIVAVMQVVILGALCAFLSIFFCKSMQLGHKLYGKYLPKPVLRAAAGGAIVICLTFLAGCYDYNGAGGDIIAAAMQGQAKPEAFLLKILFTVVSLGAGFRGGEIVPVFFTGATFGCAAAPLIGLSPSFGAAVGLVAVFCGVTNCPITSILLAFELFGGKGLSLFAMASAVSYMLSGYTGLYSEQEIVYSKVRPRRISWKVK